MAQDITIQVSRFDPDKDEAPYLQPYRIPFKEDMVVLDALNYIKSSLDGSVSFRWSCRMGICGSCGMMVNGEPKLTCSAFLRDYYPKPVRVEPLSNFPVVRDLVIDMADFMGKLKVVKPWIMRQLETPAGGGRDSFQQTPYEMDEYHQFSLCINCMLCYAACPVYAIEPNFIGPAAIALARRYDLDSRDEGQQARLPIIAGSEGIWDCSFVGECSAACPKGVDPAKAIQQTKFETTNGVLLSMLMPYGARDAAR